MEQDAPRGNIVERDQQFLGFGNAQFCHGQHQASFRARQILEIHLEKAAQNMVNHQILVLHGAQRARTIRLRLKQTITQILDQIGLAVGVHQHIIHHAIVGPHLLLGLHLSHKSARSPIVQPRQTHHLKAKQKRTRQRFGLHTIQLNQVFGRCDNRAQARVLQRAPQPIHRNRVASGNLDQHLGLIHQYQQLLAPAPHPARKIAKL